MVTLRTPRTPRTPRSVRSHVAGPHRPNYVAGFFAVCWLVVVGLPIYLILSWGLQPRSDYLDHGPLAPPLNPTWQNVKDVFNSGFLTYMANTAIVTVGSITLTLVLAMPAAYAIVRSHSVVASGSFRAFLLGLAIPAQATIIPVYLIIIRLHIYDTFWAIILPTVAFSLPLIILVLAGSLRDISRDLYEAMTVDGAGAFRIFVSLVLPLSRGAIATVSIFAGITAWNGFIFPLILTQSPEKRVVTLGLWVFQTEHAINVTGLMMGVFITALPVFLLYLFARRWLIAGLAGVGGK